MRIQLRMLVATIAFIASATAAAADTPTTVAPSGSAQSSQTAVWRTRTLHKFGIPDVRSVEAPRQLPSCDELVEELKFLLLQLGAQASDLRIDERGCREDLRLVDATFSVVSPTDKTGGNAAGTLAEAHWQIVELKTNTDRPTMTPIHRIFYRDCAELEYVTKTVLPLFAVRDVTLISTAICDKTGVGLRAEVLMPTQQ